MKHTIKFFLMLTVCFLFLTGFAFKENDILYDKETYKPVLSYEGDTRYLSYRQMLGKSGETHSKPRIVERNSKIILIGDSRVENFITLSDPDISIITKPGCRYDWLETIGLSILKKSDLSGRKIFIMSGINDLSVCSAEEAANNMERVLMEYRAQTNADEVYLVEVGPVPGPNGVALNEQIISYNSFISQYQENVPLFSYLETKGCQPVNDIDILHYSPETNVKITGLLKSYF